MPHDYKYCKHQDSCSRCVFDGCPFDRFESEDPSQFMKNDPKEHFCKAYEPED